MREDGSSSGEERGAAFDAAEAGPGLVNRLRGVSKTVGDGVFGAVDVATGRAFREQFGEFTDAVTTTVVGMHQDQAKLTEKLALLNDATTRARQGRTELRERLASIERRLRVVGGAAAASLLVSAAVLFTAFGMR